MRSRSKKVDPYTITAWQCSNKSHAVRSDIVSFIRHLKAPPHNIDLVVPDKSVERISEETFREP